MNLENASLTAVIDRLAQTAEAQHHRRPGVKGSITLNTYGDTSNIDPRNLLELILRINGFGLVQEGDLYRVIPSENDHAHAAASGGQPEEYSGRRSDDSQSRFSEIRERRRAGKVLASSAAKTRR